MFSPGGKSKCIRMHPLKFHTLRVGASTHDLSSWFAPRSHGREMLLALWTHSARLPSPHAHAPSSPFFSSTLLRARPSPHALPAQSKAPAVGPMPRFSLQKHSTYFTLPADLVHRAEQSLEPEAAGQLCTPARHFRQMPARLKMPAQSHC